MYPVSNAFLTAVKANTRKYYWTGRITTTAETVYEFDQDDMVKGSGYITSQCCGSTEIELGTVYAAEMGISLFSEINRYTLEDAKVELFYHLQVASGSYERIPMGIFEVSEANRKAKCLEIKAYDYMVRFEKAFTSLESIGNAYDFMVLCSTACEVTLAQDRATIEAMPNGTENLSIYSDNDIETYRDVLFYVGQVLGGFFVINRAGELELRKYGNTPVLTVERKHRFSSSFSDFITRYTAVSSTNLRTQIAEYYALDPDDGLTMNLGVNPLLQFGLEETRQQLCTNILNDISVVNYVPFDSDTIGNPALDLGDVLQFTGGQADSNKVSAITSFNCKIGGKMTLKGVGKNPRLAQAKSKNDKNISGLLNQIEAGRIGIHTFTNASAFTVTDTDTKIISIQFATSEDNHAQFFGQIIVDVDADAVTKTATAEGDVVIPSVAVDEPEPVDPDNPEVIGNTEEQTVSVSLPVSWSEDGEAVVHFIFEFNEQTVDIHQPEETWHSGKHTILLYYPIENVVANYTNTFNVYMRVTGGSGTVAVGGCVASISGQSMGADAAWDGKIDLEEQVTRFQIGGNLAVRSFTFTDGWEIDELVKREYTDSKSGRSGIGGFAMPVDVNGSNV
ncbi:hypothetical protein [Butyrivibrio sp. M55]|uniref:hypothetical protein n=1 Tax=Butyrivibrio sp. M55 TaxID=1855323 RepID=UPI0008EAF11A|nr:hypothetical protein [Butyrivibrio sp. M55]SFU31138.1 hypothetical protein SAMN05216540_1014 [Butyrivibrio sp. M55]